MYVQFKFKDFYETIMNLIGKLLKVVKVNFHKTCYNEIYISNNLISTDIVAACMVWQVRDINTNCRI